MWASICVLVCCAPCLVGDGLAHGHIMSSACLRPGSDARSRPALG
jgi:hypothetical protein